MGNLNLLYIQTLIRCKINLKLPNLVKHAMPGRHRAFTFTKNNPGPEYGALLESLGARYLCYGREVAPTTGTPHLQGFIYFDHGKSLARVRRSMGCHVEVARTITAAIEYCKKDGDFTEIGEPPLDAAARGQLEKDRWEKTWNSAKENKIDEIDYDLRIRNYSALKRIAKDYMVKPEALAAPCGIWIYGKSGVGKTHSVHKRFPDHYSKNASKWWDGYQNENVVVFDDVDPDIGKWAGRFLKIWGDQYPFISDVKGGSIFIRPHKVIVTSQYTIDECFPGQQQTIDAITRRFKLIEFLDREEEYEY